MLPFDFHHPDERFLRWRDRQRFAPNVYPVAACRGKGTGTGIPSNVIIDKNAVPIVDKNGVYIITG